MSDRYEISFEEGGVGVVETILTGGLAPIAQDAMDKLTGDSNHGWHCYIYDRYSKQKGSGFGWTKAIAQEHAFENLKENIDEEQARNEREKEREASRQNKLQNAIEASQSSDPAENFLIKLVGKGIGIALVIFAVIWLISNVIIPLLLINISIIALILGLSNEKSRAYMYPVSILGAILIILDYNLAWSTHRLASHVTFLAGLIPIFYGLNLGAGLYASFLISKQYFHSNSSSIPGTKSNSKKIQLLLGGHGFVWVIIIALQFFILSKNNNHYSSGTAQNVQSRSSSNLPRENNSTSAAAQKLNNSSSSDVNNSYLSPIDNLFNAWSGLNFSLYMAQWDQGAAQYSKQFKTRSYQDIFQNRKSLFDRLSSVQVVNYKVLNAQAIANNTKSINIVYSMKYYFKNGKVVNESNVSEKYVLRYNEANRQWLILENYDYIN